jgi:hypothetical protein
MRKFEQKLQELGLSINDLSIKLKNEIAEFHKMQEMVNEMANDEVDSETYDTVIEQLEQADEELIHKIIKYDKNKDGYRERAIKMQEARGRKYNPQPNISQPMPEQRHRENFETGGVVKPKKNDTAFWVLAGIVGVITLGGVIMNQNK